MLVVDLIDEAGEVVSDDGSTGMKLNGIESMNLHKQRLAPSGRVQSSRDYKPPPPDMIAVIGGMLVSESSEVRLALAWQRLLHVPCVQLPLSALDGPGKHRLSCSSESSGNRRLVARKTAMILSPERTIPCSAAVHSSHHQAAGLWVE